jgi:hypothetical protein
MLKKGDVDKDADDEVRTSASQNHATATLSTEEFFLRIQYIFIAFPHVSIELGGGGDRK